MQYSPNMLKTFETCEQKYFLKYVQNISVPQKSSSFEKGKKIHALANYYLRGDDISKLENALNPEERNVWEKLKENEYFQMNYINSEYNLSSKIGEFWIGGRIDAIVFDNNGTYYILDYKTGSIPKNPKYDYQTMVYLLNLNKRFPNSKIKFVYIDLKNNENHVIDFDKTAEIEYSKVVQEICNKIQHAKFDSEKSKKCEFCEYRKICL